MFLGSVTQLACNAITSQVSSFFTKKIITPYVLKPLGLEDNSIAQSISSAAVSASLAGLSLAGAVAISAYAGPAGFSYYGAYSTSYLLTQLTNLFANSAIYYGLDSGVQVVDKCLVNPVLSYLQLDGTNIGFAITALEKLGIMVAASHLNDKLFNSALIDTSYQNLQDKLVAISDLKNISSIRDGANQIIEQSTVIAQNPAIQQLNADIAGEFQVVSQAWKQIDTVGLVNLSTQSQAISDESVGLVQNTIKAAKDLSIVASNLKSLNAQTIGGFWYQASSYFGTAFDYLISNPLSYIVQGYGQLFPTKNLDSFVSKSIASVAGMQGMFALISGINSIMTRNSIEQDAKIQSELVVNQIKQAFALSEEQVKIIQSNSLKETALKVYIETGMRIDGFDQEIYDVYAEMMNNQALEYNA